MTSQQIPYSYLNSESERKQILEMYSDTYLPNNLTVKKNMNTWVMSFVS